MGRKEERWEEKIERWEGGGGDPWALSLHSKSLVGTAHEIPPSSCFPGFSFQFLSGKLPAP